MYGLIGKMQAAEGSREALIQVLIDGVSGLPGCLSYIIAKDPTGPHAIWITEVWESKASHEASLGLPSVQQAIAVGRPMIAGFGPERFETEPVGGHGLLQPDSA
jgi:quinol monooxygenase YgiN